MQRRVLINLLFFAAVFGVMLVWALNNIVTWDRIEHPYTITGDFTQASGVKKNAEVTYLGVHFGRVAGVVRRNDGVRVTMKIDDGKQIPEQSIARVFRKSAIGEPYIDFRAPKPLGTTFLEPGDNVPLTRTTVPLEFSELLRSASAVVSSIDPEEAGSLVHELSLALDGRSDALRSLTTSTDQITASFVQRTAELDRLAENSTRITKVFADHRLSLGRSLQNLRDLTQTLRDSNGDLQVLLDVGPSFLGTTADLVADQKRNLDCLLSDLAPVITALAGPQQIDDLTTLLQSGPTGFGYVAAASDREADGLWIRVNLIVPVDGTNPAVYVPKKSLPVVPSVSPCASTLVAATAHPFTPSGPATASSGSSGGSQGHRTNEPSAGSGTGDTGGSPLANTGGPAIAALALLLLAGGLATWRLRRG